MKISKSNELKEGVNNSPRYFINIRTKFLTTGKVCNGVKTDSDTPIGISSETNSFKEIQLQARLQRDYIRVTSRVESQLCNTSTIALYNNLQEADPLFLRARESVDVPAHSVSGKWKSLRGNRINPPLSPHLTTLPSQTF